MRRYNDCSAACLLLGDIIIVKDSDGGEQEHTITIIKDELVGSKMLVLVATSWAEGHQSDVFAFTVQDKVTILR